MAAILALLWAAAGFAAGSRGPGLSWVNSDVSYLLRVGKAMAEGRRLYVDQFDVNPPAVFLAAEATARAASALGLGIVSTAHVALLLLGAAGTWLLVRALPRGTNGAVVAAATAAYVGVVLAGGTSHFGQRPHLFLVAFVPYALQRLTDGPRPRSFAAWCVLLGFLATMKPYYAVQVVAVEASALLGTRRLDATVRASLLAGAVAPFALLGWHSAESLRALFDRVVPFLAGGSYDAYRGDAAEFLASARHLRVVLCVAAFAVAAVAAVRTGAVRLRTAVTAAVTVALAYASILHQHKFWAYHCLTTLLLCAVYAAWFGTAALCAATNAIAGRLRGAAAAVCVLASLAAGEGLRETAAVRQDPPGGLIAMCRGAPRVLVVTPTIQMYLETAALEAGLELVGPSSVEPRIGAAAAARDPAALKELVADLGATIDRERPSLVVVSTSTQTLGGGDAHEFLVTRGSLFPRPGYSRIPDAEVRAACPPLVRSVVYRRD